MATERWGVRLLLTHPQDECTSARSVHIAEELNREEPWATVLGSFNAEGEKIIAIHVDNVPAPSGADAMKIVGDRVRAALGVDEAGIFDASAYRKSAE